MRALSGLSRLGPGWDPNRARILLPFNLRSTPKAVFSPRTLSVNGNPHYFSRAPIAYMRGLTPSLDYSSISKSRMGASHPRSQVIFTGPGTIPILS